MIPARWLERIACAVDTETTCADPTEARVVTAAAIDVGEGGKQERGVWLADPEVEIPAEAAAIHGITTEYARAHGLKRVDVMRELAHVLRDTWALGHPVIIMNAPYDLTLIAYECERLGIPFSVDGPVLDPLVIDRAMSKRKGKRNLSALAAHYKVKPESAHSAAGDALMAARIVWAQAKEYPQLREVSLVEMHDLQVRAHRDWATQFQAWLVTQGKRDVIDRCWPVRMRDEDVDRDDLETDHSWEGA